MPKRFRDSLDPATLLSRVRLCARSCGRWSNTCVRTAPVHAPWRTWAPSLFIHRFGSTPNAHLHFHYVVIDGSVCIEAAERAGRKRLLRYCAGPPFALDRLRELDRSTSSTTPRSRAPAAAARSS